MKKSRIILLAILAIILVVTVAITGYRNSVISKAKTGCLVYADETVNVINLETTSKTEYNVDGYSELRCIGKYYGGDFCCVAKNNATESYEILLFKNGVIEKSYPFSYDYASVVAYNEKVYYLTWDSSNKGNLVCISGDEKSIIESDVKDFSLNSQGALAYVKYIPNDNDGIYGELYYSENANATRLGEAISAMWLSNNELLVNTEIIKESYDSKVISHIYEEYIVKVANNEWTFSKEFNKNPNVVEISPDGKNAIVYGTTELDRKFIGIYNIEKNICDKDCIYDGVNNKDIFGNTTSNILWFDKNPME